MVAHGLPNHSGTHAGCLLFVLMSAYIHMLWHCMRSEHDYSTLLVTLFDFLIYIYICVCLYVYVYIYIYLKTKTHCFNTAVCTMPDHKKKSGRCRHGQLGFSVYPWESLATLLQDCLVLSECVSPRSCKQLISYRLRIPWM